MLKKFALRSKRFCEKYCVPDGLMEILKYKVYTNDIPKDVLYNASLSYDYDYYAFTKSIKSLLAILNLLRDKEYFFNEDVMILVRSIFENHILSRYFREHIDNETEKERVINEFVRNPLGVSLGFYVLAARNILSKERKVIGHIKMPSNYKMAYDVKYYSYFYPFLCEFSHCSFGRIECYFDGASFYYDKNNFRLEAMVLRYLHLLKCLKELLQLKEKTLIQ